jgi:subtilisin family serine protease
MRRFGRVSGFARLDKPGSAHRRVGLRHRTLASLVVSISALVIALPSTAFASNDPLFAQQWGLAQIGAPSGWSHALGTGVTVGIVDTGVDLHHEDLAGAVGITANCIGANADPSKCTGNGQDDNGHGTHVSGIIAARKDNGKGIAGVAPAANLIVAKVLDSTGSGADADVQAGIMWVVNHGAKVVNLSLGSGGLLLSSGTSAPMSAGIEYAWSHGAIPVLAAGNSGNALLAGLGGGLLGSLLGANANFGNLHAVIVGATAPTGAMASYSSPLTNDQWGIAAPGGANDGKPADDVMSTYWVLGKPNAYTTLAGTSMAVPHVVGALADLVSEGYGQQAAVSRLLATADKSVNCGPSCAGLLDVSSALGGAATPAPAGAGAQAPASTDLIGGLLSLLRLKL